MKTVLCDQDTALLLCHDILDFPHAKSLILLAFYAIETPHLVKRSENAASDAENHHNEKYYEFHNCMI